MVRYNTDRVETNIIINTPAMCPITGRYVLIKLS